MPSANSGRGTTFCTVNWGKEGQTERSNIALTKCILQNEGWKLLTVGLHFFSMQEKQLPSLLGLKKLKLYNGYYHCSFDPLLYPYYFIFPCSHSPKIAKHLNLVDSQTKSV